MNRPQSVENVFIEDFENGDLPQFDSLFNHSFGPVPGLDNSTWSINSPFGNSEESGYFLGLWPAKDTITFNLQPGQAVYKASVDVLDYADHSSVTFIGVDGEYTYSEDRFVGLGGEWTTFTTENLDIGEIQSIELFSYEGMYDNIAIYVEPQRELTSSTKASVPEPGTMLAFGITALFLGMVRVKGSLQHKLNKLREAVILIPNPL